MLLLHGIYSFKKKIVAYRNDFCLSCAAPRRALQARTFDVVHIFFIPLVPLGFLRRWYCSVCNNDPHVQPGTRKSFKWLGVVVLAFFSVVLWIAPADDPWIWPMRIVLPVGFAAALWHTVRSKPDIRLKDKLREIHPADELVCPVCKVALVVDSVWRCPQCGIKRTMLTA